VSVLITMRDASRTITAALASALLRQTYEGPLEACVYDDASVDGSAEVVRQWAAANLPPAPAAATDALAPPRRRSLRLVTSADVGAPRSRGIGFGRNRAVAASAGEWLCVMDADDEAAPTRVAEQLALAMARGRACLVGARFRREPEGSTPEYTTWANGMTDAEVTAQQWRECTLIQPTWFMHRDVMRGVGGYDEAPPPVLAAVWPPLASCAGGGGGGGRAGDGGGGGGGQPGVPASAAPPPVGAAELLSQPPRTLTASEIADPTYAPGPFPEDTLFFHRHLARGGTLARAPAPLVLYRYSAGSESWRMPRAGLLATRAALFEARVLRGLGPGAWQGGFTIWGAGRDGKAFYYALSAEARSRVVAFAEVDPRKIGQVWPQQARAAGGGRPRKRGREPPGGDAAAGRGAGEGGDGDAGGGGGGGDGEPPPSAGASASPPPPRPVPIIHFSAAVPPIVCLVCMQSGGDELRANVASVRPPLVEGDNFWYFV
jgi:hypothetical protein